VLTLSTHVRPSFTAEELMNEREKKKAELGAELVAMCMYYGAPQREAEQVRVRVSRLSVTGWNTVFWSVGFAMSG
jgi:hypothetical protein